MQLKQIELDEFADITSRYLIACIWQERMAKLDGQLEMIEKKIDEFLSDREIAKEDIYKYIQIVYNNLSNSDLFRNCAEITEKFESSLERICQKFV